MSRVPFLFDDSYRRRPTRILDQHFGLALDPNDFLQSLTVPSLLMQSPAGYVRSWRSSDSERDSGSTLYLENDKFLANLDVQQFRPEEISVKVSGDDTITVEAKHEEKKDEHGEIYRHFVRRYVLPQNCDMGRIESKLSSDGVLTIYAPKVDAKKIKYKSIPITQTKEPARPMEKKCEKNPNKKCETEDCCKKVICTDTLFYR